MRSPLNWLGGKNMSVRRIVARMPEHVCYCEIFAGGASLLFGKPAAHVEVLNDRNGELMNFYRQMKLNAGRVIRLLDSMPHSRQLFEDLWLNKPRRDQRLLRAARFAYLQKIAFAGDLSQKPQFGYSKLRPHPLGARMWARIREAADRLRRVTLECGEWERMLDRYDGSETLFYADPPYVGLRHYEHNFEQADHMRLAQRLRRIQGRFLLSYNDVAQVRVLYSWAHVEVMSVPYRANCRNQCGRELLIRNYALPTGRKGRNIATKA